VLLPLLTKAQRSAPTEVAGAADAFTQAVRVGFLHRHKPVQNCRGRRGPYHQHVHDDHLRTSRSQHHRHQLTRGTVGPWRRCFVICPPPRRRKALPSLVAPRRCAPGGVARSWSPLAGVGAAPGPPPLRIKRRRGAVPVLLGGVGRSRVASDVCRPLDEPDAPTCTHRWAKRPEVCLVTSGPGDDQRQNRYDESGRREHRGPR
jgi:hypothetical protein